MAHRAPGKSDREGVTLVQFARMFPTEKSAQEWFESRIWPNGRTCPHCHSAETRTGDGKNRMPYWCSACTRYFSVRTNTVMHGTHLSCTKWVFAIYLHLTSLKGVSSMKLHRDLGITQKTAWFLLHRIREAWTEDELERFVGPVEVDEAYVGGLEKNKPEHKKRRTGRGGPGSGKSILAGARDRESNRISAEVIPNIESLTINEFVDERTELGAKVYTDKGGHYAHLPRDRESINHGRGEYVRGQVHVNGMELFWSTFRRGFQGVYHKMSAKHLQRYVYEFAGRHGIREDDTLNQMSRIATGLAGKRLQYSWLIADNGLPSGARN